MYTPQYLKKWVKDSNYGGEDLSEWYILIARTRDSDLLENSNFECIKEDIKSQFEICEDVNELNCVLLASFGHWACGWFECLMIHENNEAALKFGDQVKEKLEDYPIYNEDDYSNKEFDSFYSTCEEAVKSWLSDNDIQDNPELIAKIIRAGDNWEVTEDFYPSEFDIEEAYEIVIHTRHCNECDSDYKDTSACKCQIRMF